MPAAPAHPTADALSGGLPHPVFDAQTAFRSVMNALARPALPRPFAAPATAPAPMTDGLATIAATLCDPDTPVWLDAALAASAPLRRWLAFHTGAPVVEDPADAAFAFVTDPLRMPPLTAFAQGTADYPDRSTTLVIAVTGFAADGPRFDGAGFEAPRRFRPQPVPAGFAERVAANRALFPRGVDLIFVAPGAIAALPRSSRLLAED